MPERDSALESELAKQQRNEQMRAQFAMQANRLGPWLERALDTLFAAQSNPATTQLEQQMGGFKRMEEDLEKMKPIIMEAERCYQVCCPVSPDGGWVTHLAVCMLLVVGKKEWDVLNGDGRTFSFP